jgi:hypothetical protein
LNRTKAVACYKEIAGITESMGSNSFNLVSTKENNFKEKDYQMHITMSMDEVIKQQVIKIAQKHNLAILQEREEIVIFTPKI